MKGKVQRVQKVVVSPLRGDEYICRLSANPFRLAASPPLRQGWARTLRAELPAGHGHSEPQAKNLGTRHMGDNR